LGWAPTRSLFELFDLVSVGDDIHDLRAVSTIRRLRQKRMGLQLFNEDSAFVAVCLVEHFASGVLLVKGAALFFAVIQGVLALGF
jgi:hypothetical protein